MNSPLLEIAAFVVAGGLVLLAASFFFTLLTGATRTFRPKLINGRPKFVVEDVEFKNRDGLTLRGWWNPGNADKPVIIACHGVGGNRADINSLTTRLNAAGFGLLVFDFRGHGESDGYKASFGYQERWDLLAAVTFLKDSGRLGQRQLCLWGISMGAATICLAAAEFRQVVVPHAVVLDSSFARFAPIVKMSVKDWPWIARALFLPLVNFIGNRVFQVPAIIINPVRRVVNLAPARLLIIHSRSDELIPVEHASKLFESAKEPKTYWELDSCPHGESFLQYGETYAKRVIEFFSETKGRAVGA